MSIHRASLRMPCIGWLYTGLEKKTTVVLFWTSSGLLMKMTNMAGEQFYEKTWKSYEEFDVDFKEFCAHTKQVFSVIDSRPVAYQNIKLREGKTNHPLCMPIQCFNRFLVYCFLSYFT